MNFRPYIAALALLFALAGCGTGRPETGLPSKASITPGQTITVHGGENIYAVAREHGVSMRETIVLNNLQPPYVLRPGQELVLPARPGEVPGNVAPPPDAAPAGVVERSNLSPIEATPLPPVANAAPPAALGSLNGATATAAPTINAPPPSSATNMPTALPLNAPPPPKPLMATTVAPATPVASTPAPAAVALATPTAAPAVAPPSLVWPVQGPVISGFGPKPGGLNNDGVNIAAPKGSPVAAAGNGIVVYAGNEMKGFGNLILIRHQNGLVTAYAHLDRILVSKDAVVAQGDMIGTVGKTGDVPSPQLHFEVRREGKPIDPAGVVKAL